MVLHLMTVLKSGDNTLFLSIYAAHDIFSDPIKSFLDGLLAHNSGESVYRGHYERRGVDDTETAYPNSDHSVVCTQPATEKKTLFVNCNSTKHINHLGRAECDRLLNFLFRHVEQPDL